MYTQATPIVTLCLALVGSVNAMANESNEGNAPDTSASLEHVTVYGTSNPLTVIEYPGQVSVVDKEEIDQAKTILKRMNFDNRFEMRII